MMSIQQRYSFLFNRWGMLLLCLLASVLPVSAGPFIDVQPVSYTICEKDGGIFFSLTVHGDVNKYSFRWYKWGISDWMQISGPVGSGPTLTPPLPSEGKYMCIVTENATNEFERSNEVTLTIDKAPSITGITVPAVCNGDELVAWVDGVNTNGRNLISYMWKLGGDSIIGDKINSNTVPNLSLVADASYNNYYLTVTVRNSCGSSESLPKAVTIHSSLPLPKPVVKDYYCQGEKAAPLSIDEPNDAVWFNKDGVIIPPPIPNTDQPGIQKWWVLQQITYNEPGNPTCKSDTVVAIAEVFVKPPPPERDAEISLCVNDPGITLQVKGGSNIKWYNDMQGSLSTAPQINTSEVETQIYYVTQNNGKCESSIDDGKMSVFIRDVANADNIVLSYNPELCPNSSTIIEVRAADVTNPMFYWYAYSNKTVPIDTIPGNGSIFATPVLAKDTAYYVTIRYGTLCESNYAQAAVLNVRDITPPKVVAPSNVVVSADDGVCYATNVDAGLPIVSDNCTPVHRLIVTSNPSVDLTTRYELGDTTLIWWAKDEAGLSDYALQNISVRDRQKPWPTLPVQDIVKEIDEYEDSAIAFYDWEYEDNCTPASELIDSLYRGLPSGSVFPLGETQIIRYIIDKTGNVDTCRFKVIVQHPYREMQVNLRWNRNPICPGQEVVITPVVSGGTGRTTFSWSPRAWTAQVMRDYPVENTTYEVTVSDGITVITKNLPVTVLETRQVELSLSVEGRPISMDEIFEGDEVLVTATSGYDAYKLLLNNEIIQEAGINNYVSFQADLGTYVVRVFATDDNFCVTQDQMIIEVESNKLPNVFTPNFDEKNDIFLGFLETPNAPKDFELMIFSRAGELLYKGNKGWDGIYKGKVMSQGTYTYMARRKMNNGEYRTFKGTVTLKQ